VSGEPTSRNPGYGQRTRREEHPVTQPETHDARDSTGDPETDPAAMGEVSFEQPDGDGGAVPDGADVPGEVGGGEG
jgi:hypothetical protein